MPPRRMGVTTKYTSSKKNGAKGSAKRKYKSKKASQTTARKLQTVVAKVNNLQKNIEKKVLYGSIVRGLPVIFEAGGPSGSLGEKHKGPRDSLIIIPGLAAGDQTLKNGTGTYAETIGRSIAYSGALEVNVSINFVGYSGYTAPTGQWIPTGKMPYSNTPATPDVKVTYGWVKGNADELGAVVDMTTGDPVTLAERYETIYGYVNQQLAEGQLFDDDHMVFWNKNSDVKITKTLTIKPKAQRMDEIREFSSNQLMTQNPIPSTELKIRLVHPRQKVKLCKHKNTPLGGTRSAAYADAINKQLAELGSTSVKDSDPSAVSSLHSLIDDDTLLMQTEDEWIPFIMVQNQAAVSPFDRRYLKFSDFDSTSAEQYDGGQVDRWNITGYPIDNPFAIGNNVGFDYSLRRPILRNAADTYGKKPGYTFTEYMGRGNIRPTIQWVQEQAQVASITAPDRENVELAFTIADLADPAILSGGNANQAVTRFLKFAAVLPGLFQFVPDYFPRIAGSGGMAAPTGISLRDSAMLVPHVTVDFHSRQFYMDI